MVPVGYGTAGRRGPPYTRRVAVSLRLAAIGAVLAAGCGAAQPDNGALLDDLRNHQAAEVTVSGPVTQLLPDSNGSDGPHENFVIDVNGVAVQVIHNLDLAPRVPVRVGASVLVHGQFEPDATGPVIHYTHHATGSHEGGYVELAGVTYQ
jgi:Protein of unknown function (DUF3465)